MRRFAQDADEQIANFEAAPRIREAFGDPLANAFTGVRRSDAAWAEGKSAEEIIARPPLAVLGGFRVRRG